MTNKIDKIQMPDGQVLELAGGSGLELCDIGMALYVDETKGLRRYLNGQIVDINTNTQAFLDRLKQITTLHPSLLCTEEEWQTTKTMSTFGQVGKFVFNYSGNEIVSVRIPRVVNVQGLFDLQNLGMTVSAGLPNITGNFGMNGNSSANGAFVESGTNGVRVGGSNANDSNVSFDASRSSSIYGNSTTVQPEAIQYPYFIQIATGSETENNIINNIELNNPYSLFDSKYSDHELNNLSWLKSEGQWNAKSVYPDAYNKILENVNKGVEGYKGIGYAYTYNDPLLTVWITTPTPVVGATVYGWEPCHKIGTVESYTDSTITFFNKETNETATATRKADSYLPITSTYWINDYDFVLNTSDETFRLPLLDGSEDLPSKTIIAKTFGTDFNLPYNAFVAVSAYSSGSNSDGVLNVILPDDTVTHTIWQHDEGFNTYLSPLMPKGTKVITSGGTSYTWIGYFKAQGNGSLYFYVGETVQNANLIDAGRIGEKLADCITRTDCKAYITETYKNGTSWYRVYSDGWCEQGGEIISNTSVQTISLLKAYVDKYYTLTMALRGNKNDGWSPSAAQVGEYISGSAIGHYSNSKFQFFGAADSRISTDWRACGYIN